MTSPLKEYLILSGLTTLTVAITSVLAFNFSTRAILGPSIATIACSFPLSITVLKPGILLSDAVKTVVGCVIGWIFGATLYATATIITLHIGNRAIIATLLSFPLVCLLVLADPVCKSPLVPFFSPSVAIIVMYVMSSFAKDQAYITGVYILSVYSFSSFAILLIFFTFPNIVKLGSTRTYLERSVIDFEAKMTHWFEGLAAFMTANSVHHEAELDERRARATAALTELQLAMKQAADQDPLAIFVDPVAAENMSVTFVVLHSQLLALRGTIFSEGYTETTLSSLLVPIDSSLARLRMSTVLALRPTTPADIRSETVLSLNKQACELYTEFVRCTSASSNNSSKTGTREEIRIVFAITSVVRFAMLVSHFRKSVDLSLTLLPVFPSIWKYISNNVKFLFSAPAWKKTCNYKYAFRSALAQQFMAQLLILLTKSYPTRVGQYIFWALIPVVTTFSATVGAGLFVGSRNVLGCLLGASLGIVTAVLTSANIEAIYLQMLLICFVSKFLSNYKSLNVAALTFASTWNVLSIPNLHIEETKLLLTLVGYRISLTFLGVVTSALLSLILFPSFASAILRKSIARTVTTAAGLVCEGIVGVIERLPLRRTASFDEECSVCSASFAEGVTELLFERATNVALRTLRKHSAQIPSACEEAKPELVLFSWFGNQTNTTQVTLARLIECEPLIQRVSDCACVFSSIAASTRVLETCHAVLFAKKGFVKSLTHLVDVLDGGRVAAAVMDPNAETKMMDSSTLSGYTSEVTRELMGLRASLERAGTLGVNERNGWLLIYVFHFALVEFTAAWDQLVQHLFNGSTRLMNHSPSGLLYDDSMDDADLPTLIHSTN